MIATIHLILAMAAAFLAGGVNSIAGGGTLISFPSLMGLGLTAILANTTSTVAIWPGSIGSMWGFRKEIRSVPVAFRFLAIPAVLGGILGAWLLRHTPSALFESLVPFLILFATFLFSIQSLVRRKLEKSLHSGAKGSGRSVASYVGMFFVGVYGGYFGAGMSIMLLTALAFIGMDDILEMSAMTSFLSFCTNGIASLIFVFSGLVDWHYVFAMMVSALLGGWVAAKIARRVGKTAVRRFVIGVGVSIGIVLLLKAHF